MHQCRGAPGVGDPLSRCSLLRIISRLTPKESNRGVCISYKSYVFFRGQTVLAILKIKNWIKNCTTHIPPQSFRGMLALDFELEHPVLPHPFGHFARFLVSRVGIVTYAPQDLTWGHIAGMQPF